MPTMPAQEDFDGKEFPYDQQAPRNSSALLSISFDDQVHLQSEFAVGCHLTLHVLIQMQMHCTFEDTVFVVGMALLC